MESDVRLSMHDTSNPKPPASTGSHQSEPESHITHIRADRPVEVSFSFEHPQSRVGVGASVASHIAMALIAFLVMRYQPEAQSVEVVPDDTEDLIWLNMPGPGGGGGGGGNKNPEPPKKAELPGKEKITVPITKDPEPKLTPPEEVKPLEEHPSEDTGRRRAAAGRCNQERSPDNFAGNRRRRWRGYWERHRHRRGGRRRIG